MISLAVYLVFVLLIIAAGVARARPQKQLFMLAGSYLFYGFVGLEFLAVLIASSVLNFAIGAWLRRRPTLKGLWLGVLFNLILLSFFKYIPSAGLLQNIVMPIGISFWTFQALSYLLDLYHEEELDPSLAEFCLYMAFWPTVIMGPICRLSKLLPQFREIRSVSMEDLIQGTRRILIGLFMKVVLSQLLAPGVNAGFGGAQTAGNAAGAWSGLDVWFLAIGFGFQLFFDFAGYSNIVIGAARLFGFTLEENFDSPYLATTPSIFWTKWHMSLSSCIRDYVFIPIATSRREAWWRYFAVGFSMVIFGLWHGARFTYLIWGAYHGALLVLQRLGQQLQRATGIETSGRFLSVVSWMCTFLSISLGWVAFRADTLSQAGAMFRAILTPSTYLSRSLPIDYYLAVMALAGGYFSYTLIAQAVRSAYEKRPIGRATQFALENSWLWVTPTLALIAILTTLVVYQRGDVNVSPFVYTRF